MNEIRRTRVVQAPPPDEPLYNSVLDRDPRWIAASTQFTALRRRSRLSVATALLLAGATFASGLSVGSFLALTVGTADRPHPIKHEIWMFPYPAIGGPARPGDPLFPDLEPVGFESRGVESPMGPAVGDSTLESGARHRGTSR